MVGSELYPTDVETSGGFRIAVSPDELSVSESSQMQKRAYLIYAVFFCCVLLTAGWSTVSFVVLAALGVGIFRGFLSVHNLRCTRERLDVIDTVLGRVRRTRSFPRADVKRVMFGAVSLSKWGTVNGLVFEATGKRIKLLYGLQSVEAQKILEELRRLGFEVHCDPGMAMMVEMAKSRRSSWLGRLFV